jgi:Glycosyl hydrolases family 31/F5/8 type C domain/Domain of unknown function (DUF5110)/Carbohydrate binding module (family 6)
MAMLPTRPLIRRDGARRRPRAVAALGALALALPLLAAGTADAQGAAKPAATVATDDTSPVNLSNDISMANGKAAAQATVVEGDARFEVLTPEVVRMEYSPTGSFLDVPTFDILDRAFTPPAFTSSVQNGWLVITTADMVLRYQVGSGPFSSSNTQMQLLGALPPGAASANVSPTWQGECTFGQACQSGAATLSGGASLAGNHQGYASPAGFVAGLTATGAGASWQVLGAPAGTAQVAVRYSNGGSASRTIHLVVNGTSTQMTLPATAGWDAWSTVTAPVTLTAGTNTLALTCASGDGCNVNLDTVAVTATGAAAAPVLPAGPLGGYIRSYDSADGTYTSSPTCASGQSEATCTAPLPQMAPGLLDTSGWYLLDDTRTAVWTSNGWIANRPAGDTQDGYLFGYGQNYTQALADLAKLTGPAPLLPESLFGNWFSQYHGYSASDYENTLLPQFAANGVTLDSLSVDTNWKSPNQWDGWEWNSSLFPNPSAFLSWAQAQDLNVALNVHASISTNDSLYSQAQTVSGNTLATQSSCSSGTSCAVWDWGNVAQAESYFATAQPTLGSASFTWLDWCCDASHVSQAGVTPDSWINYLIAQQMVDSGERGFDLSRIGASLQQSQAGSYPSGPWADHRSAIAFTGDTSGTWNTLAAEAQLAQDEGAIGEPYVSDDIGSFLGEPGGGANDDDDLYLRWLQLGTFQPIMREHSNSGQNPRLPWEYDSATQAVGDQFMQLREELVPYLYSLADQASTSGLPMTQALYLDYPGQAAAYTNPGEYLLGPNMLVAPVTTPGATATAQVWFPPGTWEDYFTGATFTGPTTATLSVPTSRMPVFVKAGGIVPLQPSASHASAAGSAPTTLQVYAGGNGGFTMYDDAGTGLGYESGQSTDTPLSYAENASAKSSTVTIGAATGSYPGEPASRTYTVDLIDLSQPTSVQVNGTALAASGWTYNAATHTLQVPLPALAVGQSETVTQIGGSAVQLSEPTGTTPPPAGTNLALGAATSAGGTTSGYPASNAVDGNTSSYWQSAQSAFPQWFQVDLGSAQSVDKITLDLPPSTSWGTRTQTLSIQGSTDGSTFSTLVGSAGYTFNPATGNTVTITFSPTTTRYLRLNFTANTGWPAGQISEIQVYAN